MKYINFILIVLVFVGGNACVEPFTPKNISYSNVLVVEGFISSSVKPQQVKLSRTSPLDEKIVVPETGGEIYVKSDAGETIQFTETKLGVYESVAFAGAIGKGYTLFITTKDGRQYTSRQVILKDVPPIGKISAEFIATGERGIKITLDTEDPLKKTNYYRWDYIETYEIQTPFPSNYVVLPGTDEAVWRYERIDQCWASDTLREVLIKSTHGQDLDKVVALPLRFIPESSYIFRVKYSILVQQFAMSEQAYNYWNNLRLINETQGTLSDIQPGVVTGNIIGVTDPSETVLGYFDASAISEQRVFFDYHDFTKAGYVRPSFRNSCLNLIPIMVGQYKIASYMLLHSKEVTIWDVVGMTPDAEFELLPLQCCDCTNLGTNVKPSFWK